jgi:membrane protein implicated in regulation of membrane protease activity
VPQLIFFTAVGVAAYVGYRAFLREAERRTGTQGTLVKDPATGEYHLTRD